MSNDKTPKEDKKTSSSRMQQVITVYFSESDFFNKLQKIQISLVFGSFSFGDILSIKQDIPKAVLNVSYNNSKSCETSGRLIPKSITATCPVTLIGANAKPRFHATIVPVAEAQIAGP